MTTTSKDFWMHRLSEVLEKALAAPSERSRIAYLELARHYCSMHERADRRASRPDAPSKDPVFSAAGHTGRHDFHSVHDALMHAA
jgi:hypothetical protein